MWKPFHKCVAHLRRSWDPRASIINAFSTFLLLNFSKVVIVAAYSLYSTHIVSTNFTHYHSLYFDPTIRSYSKQHLPYLLCSASCLVVFFLIPTSLLCLYPTKVFRRLLQCCLSLRWQQAVSAFIDTFQGHYKDGTNGTHDYRAASSIHLVILFLMMPAYLNPHERCIAVDFVQPIHALVSLFYALARSSLQGKLCKHPPKSSACFNSFCNTTSLFS